MTIFVKVIWIIEQESLYACDKQNNTRFWRLKASQPEYRTEYEYPIPRADAEHLLTELCQQPLIDKHRYRVCILDLVWEIDEFHGPNRGLILAEVELSSEDQAFQKPDWIGQEVSADPRYSNASLVDYPYRSWPENGNDWHPQLPTTETKT